MKKLIIIGAGGHAQSVIDSVNKKEYRIVGLIDEFTKEKSIFGIKVIGKSLNDIDNVRKYCYFVAIGNNLDRKRWFNELIKNKLEVINIIDKTAIISDSAKIGRGCFFGKMSIVNAGATIGDNVVINTKSLVEHGNKIESDVSLATNVALNGEVHVKEGAFIGSSSVVICQKTIGKNAIIGAGAVVINDIPDDATAVGVPAKVIKNN